LNIQTWLALFAAAWAISLSPGAGAVAAMSSGLRHALPRALWTVLGLQFGVLLQLSIVAAGVGALMAASRLAFELVRWFGVLYLLYLGIRQLRAGTEGGPHVRAAPDADTPRAMIVRSTLVNAANPKATVFLLAVVPQFIDASRPLATQYLIVAATLTVVDVIVMSGYAGLASRVLAALRSPAQVRAVNRVFGGLFVTAAFLLGVFRRAGG